MVDSPVVDGGDYRSNVPFRRKIMIYKKINTIKKKQVRIIHTFILIKRNNEVVFDSE